MVSYFKNAHMKNWLSCFCLLCLPFVAKTQFQIQPLPGDTSAADIVRNHFADSNLVILSAAIYSPRSHMGLFQNGDTVIGVNAGWVMSTGNRDEIIGPPSRNLSTDLEELDFLNIIQQVERLHEGPDAQILDIEFIPLGDSIQFEFVFASEHYEGLECSADYDRLEAKLYAIEGPDRFIRSEMIEVPGKPGVPVNSNTINSGVVDGETTYCDTQDANWTENASFYAGSHPELAFNGFTKVLSSNRMPVVPGQRYNLVISLSEGDSATYDSGLFLKKTSFTSNSGERAQYEVISTQYEFCDTLRIGDLVVTEEGAYFARISHPNNPIDTFVYFGAYQLREEITLNYKLCVGDTIFIGDTSFVQPTTYITEDTTIDGCPQTTTHRIDWYNGDFVFSRFHDLCTGDTLVLNDTFFVASTIYEERVSDGTGCDSVYFHTINFNPEIYREEFISVCVGDTLRLFDTLFVEDGVYSHLQQESDSCDVVVIYYIDFEELIFEVDVDFPIEYCGADTIDLVYERDFIAIARPSSVTSSFDPFLNIPDGPGLSTSMSQTVDKFQMGTKVGELGGIAEVCLTIEHSWIFDLDIELVAPNGASIELQSQRFNIHEIYLGEPIDKDNDAPMPGLGYTYCWTVEATADMTSLALATPAGNSLPAGDYKPSERFTNLNEAPANGEWKLTLTDLWEVDDGNVFDWSIRFSSAPVLSPERQGWLELDPGIVSDSLSVSTVLPVGSHDFTYYVVDQEGCYGDTTFTLSVYDLPTAPPQIDTTICGPTMIYGHLIEATGNYQIPVGLPYFCPADTLDLSVELLSLPQVGGAVFGSYDTWTFTVNNPFEASYYFDFGDGDTSHQTTVVHTYDMPGTFLASLVIYNQCDTLIKLFPDSIVVPNWYGISGQIETYPIGTDPIGINNTLISSSWSDGLLGEQNTDSTGAYMLEKHFEFSSPTIHPTKAESPLNGLDVADLIQLARYLIGNSILVGPHQILAADLDCNNKLDQADLQLLRRLLLEPGLQFPDSCSNWIFWPQSYAFPDPDQPFGYPNSITIDSIQQDTSGIDFYGIKRGDLGNNASPSSPVITADSLFFLLENGAANMGDTIRATFRTQNFEQLVGFQFELQFDTTALSFVELELGTVSLLEEQHFGLSLIDTGLLRVVWLDILGDAQDVADLEEAFTLTFVARKEIIDRKQHIAIIERDIRATAFDANLFQAPVALKIDQISSWIENPTLTFSLLQNRPNPFTNRTIIPFELPKSARATLRVYNQLGQEVWRKTAQYPAGQSQEELHLTAAGLYYYSLETPWGNATKRMVLTKE